MCLIIFCSDLHLKAVNTDHILFREYLSLRNKQNAVVMPVFVIISHFLLCLPSHVIVMSLNVNQALCVIMHVSLLNQMNIINHSYHN